MRGIKAGKYLIRAEIYEPWTSNEKLNFTTKEVVIEYIPKTRESRLRRIPTVKSVAGTALTIISSDTKNIYHKIEQDLRRENLSKRDDW